MSAAGKTSALAKHRERQRRAGLRRVEVLVREEDAQSIRDVAAALADPVRAPAARALLRSGFPPPPTADLKAWIESMPAPDDFDLLLERPRSPPRDVEL